MPGVLALLVILFLLISLFNVLFPDDKKSKKDIVNDLNQQFLLKVQKLSLKKPDFENSGYYPYIILPEPAKFLNPQLPYKEDLEPEEHFYGRPEKTLFGRSESGFRQAMHKKFDHDKIVKEQLKYSLYTPDIIYHDKEKKILIDIEIDEPYSMKDKRPLHYLEEKMDNVNKWITVDINQERDRTFTYGGWIVIRFSENQVLNFTQECLSLIRQVINYIELFDGDTPEIDYSFIEKRWTLKEIEHLVKLKTRGF